MKLILQIAGGILLALAAAVFFVSYLAYSDLRQNHPEVLEQNGIYQPR